MPARLGRKCMISMATYLTTMHSIFLDHLLYTLLRCFQYLAMESISYGDFCWNGECLNCQVWLEIGGKEKAVMACRTIVAENMKIVRMADGIDLSEEATGREN